MLSLSEEREALLKETLRWIVKTGHREKLGRATIEILAVRTAKRRGVDSRLQSLIDRWPKQYSDLTPEEWPEDLRPPKP